MYTLLLVLLILDAFVLGIVILLQAGSGGGLAALGGGAGTDTFVGGRQAVTILTRATRWCGALFLGLSLVLSIMSSQSAAPRSILQDNIQAPLPIQEAPLPFDDTPASDQGAPAPSEDPQ